MFILKLIEWFGREKKSGVSMMSEDAAFAIVICAMVTLIFIADKVV